MLSEIKKTTGCIAIKDNHLPPPVIKPVLANHTFDLHPVNLQQHIMMYLLTVLLISLPLSMTESSLEFVEPLLTSHARLIQGSSTAKRLSSAIHHHLGSWAPSQEPDSGSPVCSTLQHFGGGGGGFSMQRSLLSSGCQLTIRNIGLIHICSFVADLLPLLLPSHLWRRLPASLQATTFI